MVVSNTTLIFVTQTLILWEFAYKKSNYLPFWYNVNHQTNIPQGEIAHGHYTILTFYNSIPLPPELPAY